MFLPPTVIPAPRRVRRRRKWNQSPTPAPLVMTGVIEVTGAPEGLAIRISVDATEADPVEVAGADPAKWEFRTGDTMFRGVSISSPTWNEVSIVVSRQYDDPSPAYLTYFANPSDIATASGRKLEAFNWPMG